MMLLVIIYNKYIILSHQPLETTFFKTTKSDTKYIELYIFEETAK